MDHLNAFSFALACMHMPYGPANNDGLANDWKYSEKITLMCRFSIIFLPALFVFKVISKKSVR